jgi:hypothetical protein
LTEIKTLVSHRQFLQNCEEPSPLNLCEIALLVLLGKQNRNVVRNHQEIDRPSAAALALPAKGAIVNSIAPASALDAPRRLRSFR